MTDSATADDWKTANALTSDFPTEIGENQEVWVGLFYTWSSANAKLGSVAAKVSITPATLEVSGADFADKTYDGTTTATVNSVTFKSGKGSELVKGADYTVAGEFADKNAANGKKNGKVTVTLGDTDKAGNYTIVGNPFTVNGVGKINHKALTIAANNLTVDLEEGVTAETVKSLFTLDGVVSGETVDFDYSKVKFEVNGTEKPDATEAAALITSEGTYTVKIKTTVANALGGTDKDNYTLANNTEKTATLTVAEVYYSSAPSAYKVTCGDGVKANKSVANSGSTVTLTVAEGYEAPVVTDKNGKTVAVTEGKDGKFTFKMPASAVTVSVTKAAEVVEVVEDAVCTDCVDVDVEAWSHEGIHYCLENGLMNGVAADTFAPAATTTRGMIVTMLARLSGYSVNGEGSQWYVPSMEWAVANGVSDGTNMTGNITREQLATMLYNYAVKIAKVDVDKFTADTNTLSYEDVFTVSEWANAGVHFCLASGVIGGYEDGTIRPQANATRAEVAKMFMSFCENVLAK